MKPRHPFYLAGRPVKETELPGMIKKVLTTPRDGKNAGKMELTHSCWEYQTGDCFGEQLSGLLSSSTRVFHAAWLFYSWVFAQAK